MKTGLAVLICLYLVGLHCSIALMEIFSWSTFGLIVALKFRRREWPDWPLAKLTFALIAVVGISLMVNPWLKPFWFQFGFMRWVFLLYSFYWALCEVWSAEFERRFLILWNILILIGGVYALLQCFTGLDLVRPGFQQVIFDDWGTYKATGYFAMKATSFFSLSLTFAYVLGISMFSAGAPIFKTRYRHLGWAARLAAFGGIFATMSRGAWIAVVICQLGELFETHRRRLAQGLGILAGAFLVMFFVSTRMHDRLTHFNLDHSSMTRVDIWRGYLAMFAAHPRFGIGLLQGDVLLPDYYTKLGISQEFVSHAHNVYLQWAAGAGVFALLIYLALAGTMLRMAWRLRKVTPWGLGLFYGQMSMHIGAFTECNFFDAEVLHMMIFAWALTLMFHRREMSNATAMV